MSSEIKYALKHKKKNKLVGYYTSSNDDGDFCCETQYILDINEDNMWYTDTPEHAEWVRNNSTPWYNANYNTPSHFLKANDLVVVKIETTTDMEEVEVKLPTYEEWARVKTKGKGKQGERDYEFYMYQKRRNPEIIYNYYDLIEIMSYRENKEHTRKIMSQLQIGSKVRFIQHLDDNLKEGFIIAINHECDLREHIHDAICQEYCIGKIKIDTDRFQDPVCRIIDDTSKRGKGFCAIREIVSDFIEESEFMV